MTNKESAENLDISTRGSFAHKTTAEGRELLDLILVNDFFGRSEAVPEVKIIHEESLHVESEEEEIHSLEIPFQFEEDLFEDYGNTSNYSCEKRPPTKVNSNDPLDKAMLKETVKKLTIIMSNEWLREGELSSESIQIRCPASTITCLIGGRTATSVPVLQSTKSLTEPLPVPEPIEIVMVVSPFEAPESIFEESIKEFNEGEDESGETIDLPKTDQPSRAPIDLKPLPSSLSYAFLNGDVESPVIISDKLSERETARLIAVLEKHRAAFGYSLQDLKGISPTLCTHHIPLEPSCTPSREPQRRLNNVMKEVVKKEVLKLLHVGIIYPMPYSEWVSPVQVVPKKGGMTVVENSNNELIP
uniref:OSJNBa0032B23.4 protein n=1 Tax=Oryza sativa subsp. japonica TaxID=39947 RepID=Q7XWP0_ORYSJ|nr:OSJNBa0032B23.4 [Oryza sativa Japonica Group]